MVDTARVTQQFVEILLDEGPSKVEVTQQFVEVLWSPEPEPGGPPAPPARTFQVVTVG